MQVLALLKDASALETDAAVARSNRAQILNFYAVFPAARKLWEQLQGKVVGPLVSDGLGVALQGTGNGALAKGAFAKAREAGADPKRFSDRFHEAAALMWQDPDGCLDLISNMSDRVSGFERNAVNKLEETCRSWKQRKDKRS
ncbi:hypothetical protein EBZ37_05890 [bacterium]|nr:hypothetical protein [bacterium]